MKQKLSNFDVMISIAIGTPQHRNTGNGIGKFLKLCTFIWMLMKVDVGWGQCSNNLIQNPHFEMNEECQTSGQNGSDSFANGCVDNWFAPSGTPHHVLLEIIDGVTYCPILQIPAPIYDGSEVPCMGMGESICQNVPVVEDQYITYTFSVDVKGIRCENNPTINHHRLITLTKNTYNVMNYLSWINLPYQTLISHTITDDVNTTLTTTFTVQTGSGYNQLWFRRSPTGPDNGTFTFDNAILTCETTSLTDIIYSADQLIYNFEGLNQSENHEFTEYSWDFGDGSTSTQAEPTHIYEYPGTYNVCLNIINDIGCCGSFCKQIIVTCRELESPVIDISTSFCSNYLFSISNPNPSVTYIWNIVGGNPATGTGTTFCTDLNASNGLYTISVTAENSCGSAFSSEIISFDCTSGTASCSNQNNCVNIGTDINSVTLLSDLVSEDCEIIPHTPYLFGISIENLCFSVEGTLIIDVPQVFFNNTHWYMAPGSTIEVASSGIWGGRYFSNSHFEGCTRMWRGIVVKENTSALFANGGLSLFNTTIEDAWRGVELENYTVLITNRAKFYDNYTGIYTVEATGQNNIIHTEIKNTVFEDKGNMLPAYPGQPNYNLRFYAGIISNNVNAIVIGSLNASEINTFKNLRYGIRSHHSNLFIYNNEFIDTYWNGSSNGILIVPSGPISTIQNDNNFINLSSDIYINGGTASNISIQGNNESIRRKPNSGISRSIHILNNISSAVNIKNFTIFGNDLGIRLEGEFKNLKVENNELTVEGPSARFIDINNVNSSGNTSSISNNNILFDLTGSYANTSLFKIKDCGYLSVINNVIHNNTGVIVSGQSTAFDVSGTDKSLFKENKVYWPGRGFTLFGSESGEVNGYCCNTAKEVPTSSSNFNFRFYSNHGESFFRQNKLNRLNLFTGADIGPQKNAGNLWEGPGSLASISNGTLQDAQDNPFFTNFNIQGAKPLNIHPIIFEEDWFININQSIPTCQNNPDCGIPPFSFQDDDEDLTDDGPDAQDPPIIIVDPARPTCDALKDLYKRLEGIDSIASPVSYWSVISLINKWKIWKGASWIEACLDSVVTFNPDITPWYDAEKEKDGVYKATQSQRQLMAPYMSDMLALTEDISQSTMTLTPAQVQLYQDLNTAHNLYTSGVNVFKQSIVDRANNLLPDLIALPTPLPFLADKKKVWIAEMKIVIGGISALDSIEWNEIREIALKCPNEFGQAVFEAQTLMRSIGEDYSSDPECVPSKPRSKNERVITHEMMVSPNPGSGLFDFLWHDDVQIDQISVYDINGRLIIKKDITSGQNQISVDIINQVSGVYIWEAISGNEIKQKGKIIKI